MIGSLRKFLKERTMVLSTDKTKVMIFNRKGNSRKGTWIWGNKKLEEVDDFKYLGFTFNCRGDYKSHMEELKNNGVLAAKKVWGLRERCRGNLKRRKMFLNYLFKSVMEYGVEIWGWNENRGLEKI